MGRELTGNGGTGKKTPTVRFEAAGQKFIGTLRGMKLNPKKQQQKIWAFAALDGDAPITVKTDKGYEPATINEGDEVALFGTVQLDDKLSKAVAGEKIEITYKGKVPTKNGNNMKDFSAVVIE